MGCLTRVYKGELPYLKSWLLHYKRIGISHFYLIHTREDPLAEAELLSVINSCDVSFTLLTREKGARTNSCFDGFIPLFKEQYLLHVDVDEFLFLQSVSTIQAYIQAHPAQYYRYRWVMCPYDGHGQRAHLTGSISRGYKSMAVTRLIRSITPHTMSCGGENTLVTHDEGGLLHYWGRSFTDIVIKCLHGGELSRQKVSSLEELTTGVTLGRLPNRFKMLAVLSRRASEDVLRPNFVERDAASELRLVAELTPRQRSELFAAYSRYRDSLTEEIVRGSFTMSLVEYVGHMP